MENEMNCEINDIVKFIKNDDGIPNIGDEGIVTSIVGYGIDILMDTGSEIRVINSDFNKHFKVIGERIDLPLHDNPYKKL